MRICSVFKTLLRIGFDFFTLRRWICLSVLFSFVITKAHEKQGTMLRRCLNRDGWKGMSQPINTWREVNSSVFTQVLCFHHSQWKRLIPVTAAESIDKGLNDHCTLSRWVQKPDVSTDFDLEMRMPFSFASNPARWPVTVMQQKIPLWPKKHFLCRPPWEKRRL